MKEILTWEQIERDTFSLATEIIKAFPDYKDLHIVCIARGGLFVGGLLSYMLGNKNIHCVSLSSYHEENQPLQTPVQSITEFLPTVDKTKTYLFVDDVNDTSETYKFVKSKSDELGLMQYFATTYHKARGNNLLPDFYGKELSANAWLVFPWDQLSR